MSSFSLNLEIFRIINIIQRIFQEVLFIESSMQSDSLKKFIKLFRNFRNIAGSKNLKVQLATLKKCFRDRNKKLQDLFLVLCSRHFVEKLFMQSRYTVIQILRLEKFCTIYLTFSICYASYTIAKDAENDFFERRLNREKLTF